MKNIVYIVLLILFTITYTACAPAEECVCNNLANITESDAKDYNTTLKEACDLAKFSDATCAIQ
jgi:hypothetical protein